MYLSFDEFIKEFNDYIFLVKSDHGSKELEKKLGEAIHYFNFECESLFSEKKVASVISEMKAFCHRQGQIEYKIDQTLSMIAIKKGTRWAEYKLVPINIVLKSYFALERKDEFFDFIGVYLSQEELFAVIQIYIVLSSEEKTLH
jgi:hypothetical protein